MTKKILVIDDEPDFTYTIKTILEDNGFEVLPLDPPGFDRDEDGI